jgi:membrane-bound lytic murein transglycosylase A
MRKLHRQAAGILSRPTRILPLPAPGLRATVLAGLRRALLPAAVLGLAGCAGLPADKGAEKAACAPCVCPVCPGEVAPPTPPQPPAKPLQPATWSELTGWGDDDLAAAWPAFQYTCQALRKRAAPANATLWRQTCDAADALAGVGGQPNTATLRAFFEARFEPWAVSNPDGSRDGLITGYYEPLLKGRRERGGASQWPLLGVPDDLLTVELAELFPELKDKRVRGRVQGNKVVPYFTRGQIREREMGPYKDKILAWVDDPVELFFLQIQGSGRIQLPDGSLLRVGYADQNGHPYQSVGRLLIDRGELKAEQASMQGIQAWARANPNKLNDLLDANPSYVFFRELPGNGDGPLGALNVPVTGGRTLAVDPRNIPLGAPVFLATSEPNSSKPLNRLMLAQDTGGAIKGAVRADFFWGFGPEAGAQAGRMRQKGRMWVLLPKGYVLPNGK